MTTRLRELARRVADALDPGEDDTPPRPYPAGAAGTAGAGYRIPEPRTTPEEER